jgi:hypothetical protein
MEQPEPTHDPTAKAQLPDPKGALPIPDHFRLPFHGKMATPTAVPSETQRRYHITFLKRRGRRRGILAALCVAEVLILTACFLLHVRPVVLLSVAGGMSVVFGVAVAVLYQGPRRMDL